MRRIHVAAVLTTSLALLGGSLSGVSSAATSPSPAASSPASPAASSSTASTPTGSSTPGATSSAASEPAAPAASTTTAPVAPGTTAPPAASPTTTAPVAERRAPGRRGKTPDNYTPRNGVRYNDPLAGSPAKKRKLLNHLLRTINSVPRGADIRIASWNIRSPEIASALIAAHHRGVSVQAVMDRLNANPSNPNTGINRMVAAFNRNKAKRPKERRSSVTKCLSSCRSTSGIAHTKFFLFSEAGKATDVVMYGSNNATDLAAYAQWNDLYTLTDPTIYAEFAAVFAEMRRDKPYRQPYLTYDHGPLQTYFYPYRGEGTSTDPLLDELAKVQCTGATGAAGSGGRTVIRIAQTSMHGQRGITIAQRLRQMYQEGCDIQIVYAVFGNNVLKVLRNTSRGAIPLRQIAQDFNLDGVYDRYLHMKTMTVSGVYAGNTEAQVTWNGSANWTSVALASDEIVARIDGADVVAKYARWFEKLYRNPPRFRGRMATVATVARMSTLARGVSPEQGIEVS